MMDEFISPAGVRVLECLVGFPPKTIAELMSDLGVTRTAVTEQLSELVSSGIVRRITERRESRGRPQYRYTVMPEAAARIVHGNQHLLVPAIWSAVESIGGDVLLDQITERTAENLAAECVADGLSWAQRVANLVRLGGVEVVEIPDENSVRVQKRTCRFFSMYEPRGVVCDIHLRTIAKIMGGQVVQTASRHAGAPCCEFLILKKAP